MYGKMDTWADNNSTVEQLFSVGYYIENNRGIL
jgi:hypothetical protein